MGLILNERTEKKVNSLSEELPHAVLLSGERGIGLTTVAKHIAGKMLTVFVEPLNSKDEVDHDTGTISVTNIRTLYSKTRAKNTSRQIVVIDSAHRMSLGAQAAFLKLLEEPTEHTHFILTSHAPQTLLPTIRSRVQTTHVEPISETQTFALLDSLGITDSKKKNQLIYLASGHPAELIRLARDEAYFKKRADTMTDTRNFLRGDAYEKLLIVNKYHHNRTDALQLIDSALLVTRKSLTTKPQPRLVAELDILLNIQERIEANCNIRLQLMSFVI